MSKKASEAAKELSKLGAKKGGYARAKTLTPDERSEIARQAVEVRWARQGKTKKKKTPADIKMVASNEYTSPYSLFTGTLEIGDMKIDCHVLNDHRRVLTRTGTILALGMSKGSAKSGGDRLINFIDGDRINPFISNELNEMITKPIVFEIPHRKGLDRGEYRIPSSRASSNQKSSGNILAQSCISSAINAWSFTRRAFLAQYSWNPVHSSIKAIMPTLANPLISISQCVAMCCCCF